MDRTQQAREAYIQHYVTHYANTGVNGSGTGEYEQKLELWRRFGYKDGMTVLDYGAGWGAVLPGITNHKGYLGVDIVPQACEIGREKFPDATFEVLEIGKLEAPKFDWTVAMSVFTHALYSDVPDMLRDIRQSLTEGMVDILEGEDTNDTHIRYWRLEDFLRVLEENGIHGEFADKIAWNNGHTHSYIKIVPAQ